MKESLYDFEDRCENFQILIDNLNGNKISRCGELVQKEISKQVDSFNADFISSFLWTYQSLSHKNIIEIVEVFEAESSIIITSRYIQEQCMPFSDPCEALKFLRDCAEGLFYLQRNGIAHNDIKIDNILKSSSGRYIIIDLDYMTCEKYFNNKKSEFLVGTQGYFSPEKIKLKKRLTPFFNAYKSDVFSLGMVFLEMIYIKKLACENSYERLDSLYGYLNRINFEWARDLIWNMIKKDPWDRPNFRELNSRAESLLRNT